MKLPTVKTNQRRLLLLMQVYIRGNDSKRKDQEVEVISHSRRQWRETGGTATKETVT